MNVSNSTKNGSDDDVQTLLHRQIRFACNHAGKPRLRLNDGFDVKLEIVG